MNIAEVLNAKKTELVTILTMLAWPLLSWLSLHGGQLCVSRRCCVDGDVQKVIC